MLARISRFAVRPDHAICLLSSFLGRSTPVLFPQNLPCVHCTVAGVAVENSTSEPRDSFFIVS
jgi:hypothetical protein